MLYICIYIKLIAGKTNKLIYCNSEFHIFTIRNAITWGNYMYINTKINSLQPNLWVGRICSHEVYFRKHTMQVKSRFLKSSYSNDVIQKKMKLLKFSKISSTRNDNTKGVLLVVTCQPDLKNINQIICTLFISIKKLRKYLHQNPLFLSVVPGNWVAIWLELNFTIQK